MTNIRVVPKIVGMPFVRTKKIYGQTYYYLVQNVREGSKVRQKVLKYLGKDKPSSEELERIISQIRKGD